MGNSRNDGFWGGILSRQIGNYKLFKIFCEIKDIMKKESNIDIKTIIHNLALFINSDDFISYSLFDGDKPLSIIDENLESIENNFFLKIFFPLLEELKKLEFEQKMKLFSLSEEKKKEYLNNYENEKIYEIQEICARERDEKIDYNYNKVNSSLNAFLFITALFILFTNKKPNFLLSKSNYNFKEEIKNEKIEIIQNTLNYFLDLENINNLELENLKQIFIFHLYTMINYKKIKL